MSAGEYGSSQGPSWRNSDNPSCAIAICTCWRRELWFEQGSGGARFVRVHELLGDVERPWFSHSKGDMKSAPYYSVG